MFCMPPAVVSSGVRVVKWLRFGIRDMQLFYVYVYILLCFSLFAAVLNAAGSFSSDFSFVVYTPSDKHIEFSRAP